MSRAGVKLKAGYLGLLALMSPLLSLAAEPPILRLETGMHTASIYRIAVDAGERFLVTASDDKTARLWSLPEGRLLQVLRPPIGEANEGKLYAVAISPDARTIATGGSTGRAGNYSIYLFDRQSGRLTRRIGGLPSAITHLAYSKDGRFLAAGLGGDNGIRIYRSEGYTLAVEDRDYGDNVLGLDFGIDGRLATVSDDGFVRLYGSDLKRIEKRPSPGGKKPFSISFSPDGGRLAVGFHDSTRIDVLSGRDLKPVYSPDTTGIDNGNIGSVAWSSDGRFLYAGGTYGKADSPIVQWKDAGRGERSELPAASNTITEIVSLKSGGVAFGTADPAFGIVDQSGQKRLFRTAAIADFRGAGEGFRLSQDGATVEFGFEQSGRSPARFSVNQRLLETGPLGGGLSPPLTRAEGLEIAGVNTSEPKLNGLPLKLEPYETARSFAIAPDQQTFLLGTEWRLRLFDRKGKQNWEIPVPAQAWAVNIAGDGRIAGAAFGDGTIRWYRLTDGKEILALFPHNDRLRWVLWTPGGYYDASPGADIDWHLNKGSDQAADFYPASRFREVYYRPEVIAKLLETLDTDQALRLAERESGQRKPQAEVADILPPVVRILSPEEGSEAKEDEITVRFQVRSPPGAAVTEIKALVDGRPRATEYHLNVTEPEFEREIRVPLPERDSDVGIIAKNRHSWSEAAKVRVRWAGRSAVDLRPKLYVLAIGVGKYRDERLKLAYAAKDAHDFVLAIARQEGRLYRKFVLTELLDEKANKDAILDGLDWIQKQTTANDVAMIFLAGHGVDDPNNFYYFLPVGADTGRLKSTAVPYSEIENTVQNIAGKVLFFADTCRSGDLMGGRRGPPDIQRIVNELASAENGAVVFASSTGNQYSQENPKWENGAFTKALVEGLNGARAEGGRVTINLLAFHISERVKELTKGTQTPPVPKPSNAAVGDFPIASPERVDAAILASGTRLDPEIPM